MMIHSPLAELSTTRLVLGGFGAYFVLSLARSYLRTRRYPPDIEFVGTGKGFFAAFKEMKTWVEYGYEVYNKKSQAYILPGVLGNEPQVIIPRSQMSWLVDQPDHVLSTSDAHYDILHGDYSFVTPELLRNPFHEHVIHRSLARHLPALVPELEEEVCATTDDIFGFSEEWKTFNIQDSLMKFIPRVTNRMMIGLPVCRTQGYLDNMVAFTNDVVRNMPLLGIVPPVLKPLIGPLAALPAKYHYWKMAKYSLPIVKQRLADFERKESGDPEYADWVPPNDYISWHIALARSEGNAVELHPTRIAQRLIPLNFAAIHTTGMTALNLFLDILSSDAEYGTLALLTEEVRQVYAEEGGRWTKAALGRLYRLDSAIRESMRVSVFAQTLVQKKVVAREGVTNPVTGWHFEYGTVLSCPLWGAQHDRELFGEKADAYDPLRFSRGWEEFEARDASEKSADERLKLQKTGLVTTSDSHFPFGHGRHACPGRFFVAHELKMLFSHLLLNYDLMPIQERPETKWVAGFSIPPTQATMQIKRRPGTC